VAPLLLANVRIVDVATGHVSEPSGIVMVGDRIAGIGSAPPTIDPPRWVVPGLIDVHVHLTFDASGDPIRPIWTLDTAELEELALANAALAVRAGITTVRDLGAPLDVISAAAARISGADAPGPDVVFAGASITRVGGHLSVLGGEVSSPAEARAMVERQLAAGARAIKVVVSGGGLTPGTRTELAELPLDVLRAAVEVARSNGVPVAAHCHATEAIARAADAGVTTIEHGSFVGLDGHVRFDRDLALRLADAGIAVDPTLSGSIRTAARYRTANAHNPSEHDAMARLESRPGIVATLRDAGVTIVAGSDGGVTETPLDSLHDDLAALVRVGMTPLQALGSATVDAARILALPDRGEVAVGRRADLLVLDRDPLVDLATLRTPVAVIAGGREVSAATPR
jgi:imidazolonepropionase-like amidohydrolase